MTDKLTILYDLYTKERPVIFSVQEVIDIIKYPSGDLRQKTLQLQQYSKDPKSQKSIKLSLPVLIANGEFNKRCNESLVHYGKHLIVDFDYPQPLDISKRDMDWDMLKKDPYVKVQYHTPRGGIKLIIEHDNIDPEQHKQLNQKVWDYFDKQYGLKADINCGGLAHSHFLCYDPDVVYNAKSKVFNFQTQLKPKPYSTQHKSVTGSSKKFYDNFNLIPPKKFKSHSEAIKEAISWSDRRFPIVKGFRNNNLFKMATLLHDWAVPKDKALTYLTIMYVEPDFLGDEIKAIVDSAYS